MKTRKQFIILDTETTGLPRTPRFGAWYNPSETRYYDDARVIQVAVVSETESHTWFIQPEGFKVENSEFHGITHEMAMSGVSWDTMIVELLEVLGRYEVIVGHNVLFDINVLAAEMYRREQLAIAGEFLSIPYECTMYMGKLHMHSRRFPKLIVLYEYLFGEKMEQKHDALEDCQATYDCYVRMNDWNLERKFKHTPKVDWKKVLDDSVKKSLEFSQLLFQKLIARINKSR